MGKFIKLIVLFILLPLIVIAQNCDSLSQEYRKIRNRINYMTAEEVNFWVDKLEPCAENNNIQRDLYECFTRLKRLYLDSGNFETYQNTIEKMKELKLPLKKSRAFNEERFGTLRILFNHPFYKMGRVKEFRNIKLEAVIPPPDKGSQSSLDFLNSENRLESLFRLNHFDRAYPEKGFFIELKFIPFLEYYGDDPQSDNFYILTINNKYRWHIIFSEDLADSGIVEYKIPWQKNWTYIEEIDPSYLALSLPSRYNYLISPSSSKTYMGPSDGNNNLWYIYTASNDSVSIFVEKSKKQKIIETILRYSIIVVYSVIIFTLLNAGR